MCTLGQLPSLGPRTLVELLWEVSSLNIDINKEQKIINLTKDDKWKIDKNVKILSSGENLTMYVDNQKLNKSSKKMTLDTVISNTEAPLLLLLDYSSKSLSAYAKFSIEIKDSNGLTQWKKQLKIHQVILRMNCFRYQRTLSWNQLKLFLGYKLRVKESMNFLQEMR